MTTEVEHESVLEIDGALFDEETGEIIEVPGGADKLAWLQEQQLFAKRQQDRWEEHRRTYARAIEAELTKAGVKTLTSDAARSTWVAPRTEEKSEAHAVRDAVRVELLTEKQAEHLLIAAAKTLDPKAVRTFIDNVAGDDKTLRERLELVLIGKSERSGYVLTKAAAVEAPEARKLEAVK